MIARLDRVTARAFGLSLIIATGLSVPGGPVLATTPDGDTPANEHVCDVLKGGTAGLYGLCVAYCEAQDLDLVGDKDAPNNKILANYRKKMQAGDPDMPCIQVPCPCWSAEQLANLTGSGGVLSCVTGATTAQVRNSSTLQFATIDTERPSCRFTDTSTAPRISVRFNEFTADEAQSCYSQVVQACSDLGL